MKIPSLFSALCAVLLLSSCSRYQADVVYTPKLDVKAQYTQQAKATEEMKAVAPVASIAPAAETNTDVNAEAKTPVLKGVKATVISKTSGIVRSAKKFIAQPITLASAVARHKMPLAKSQDVQPGSKPTPGGGLFLLLLSALAVVSAAILLFTGFSTSQTIIAIAGVVLFVIGVVVFGMAAASIAKRNSY